MSLPIADWNASLDEMDAALTATRSALDHYEATWQAELGEAPPAGDDSHRARLEERLGEWDMRLAAASELADSVELELNERETVVGRWRELFDNWRALLGRRNGEAHI